MCFKKGKVIETLPKAILEIQNILELNFDSKSTGKTAFQSQLWKRCYLKKNPHWIF